MNKRDAFVLHRFEQIAPIVNIDDMDLATLERNASIGFEIIGYEPRDLGACVPKACEKMDGKGELYRFLYNCWRFD